jgi:hypothetical protein
MEPRVVNRFYYDSSYAKTIQEVAIKDLQPGMVINNNKGTPLTALQIQALRASSASDQNQKVTVASSLVSSDYKFQQAMASYMYGDTFNSTDLMTMNSEELLQKIKPIIKYGKKGVFIVIENFPATSEFMTLMKSYKAAIPQSTPFILQTYNFDSSPVKGANNNTLYTSNFLNILGNTDKPEDNTIMSNTLGTVDVSTLTNLKDNVNNIESLRTLNSGKVTTVYVPDKSTTLYLRLYPQSAQIVYPSKVIDTTVFRNNKVLTTSSANSNLGINLMGNLAVNTADTQWFDIYANFFRYFIEELGNKRFTLIVGEYVLPKCFLTEAPLFVNTLSPANTFDLKIISEVTSIKDL